MAKIMLVEDDNNLREIYEARLLAEGYEIVSAKDGEEALALAVKERPDLIISDVMMPKISGFDMLDILRSTPETKDTKVIMMTALSQAEDKNRADKLGADRYLVKSQVTLEDVAKVAREVLSGETPSSTPQPVTPSVDPPATPPVDPPKPPVDPPADPTPPAPIPDPVVPTPVDPPADLSQPVDLPSSATSVTPVDSSAATVPEAKLSVPIATEEAEVEQQIKDFIAKTPGASTDATLTDSTAVTPQPAATKIPVQEAPSPVVAAENAEKLVNAVNELMTKDDNPATKEPHKATASDGSVANKKIIQPLNPIFNDRKKLDELVAKEEADERAVIPLASATTDPNKPQFVEPATAGSPDEVNKLGTPALPGTDPNSIAL